MIERFLLRSALRDLVSLRRVAVAACLVLGPSCIALLIRLGTRSDFDGVATYGALASLLVFGFVLPILAVVFGTGAITQEMEQKTIVYLLTRPVPRWRILIAKYLAVWISISATSVLAVLVLAAVTYQRNPSTSATRLSLTSVKDMPRFLAQIQTPENAVADYLRSSLSPETAARLDRWNPETQPGRRLSRMVFTELNRLIATDRAFYSSERFAGISLPEDVRQLIANKPRGSDLARLNMWLIEAAFPDLVKTSRAVTNQVWRDALILPIGAAAYGAFFLFLATLFQRALITGLFLSFGWESWVPMLPGNFKLVSVMTYLRALAPHAKPETTSYDMMQLLQALSPETVPASLAWTVLAASTAGALILAVLVFSMREYVPKDDSI
jgi:ABC-type transport system involved in multi-copper enzyme maturation permease subunit